jgi:hypothetical protein
MEPQRPGSGRALGVGMAKLFDALKRWRARAPETSFLMRARRMPS